MTSADLLVEICARCKASVSVTVNQHRDYYESVQEYLRGREPGLDPEVLAGMIARDTVVEVQAYPNTPVAFHYVVHWDLLEALRLMADALGVQ